MPSRRTLRRTSRRWWCSSSPVHGLTPPTGRKKVSPGAMDRQVDDWSSQVWADSQVGLPSGVRSLRD